MILARWALAIGLSCAALPALDARADVLEIDADGARWVTGAGRAQPAAPDESMTLGTAEVPGDIVINCVGLGARELCGDEEIRPSRGQVILLDQDPGIGHFDQQPESLTYTIPRSDVTVLGGTSQIGDWGLDIRAEDTEAILQKVEALWPDLDRSKIVGSAVGLRPSRTEVRLVAETISGRPVIHNYGHGGAGVTLSWGCADEVARLVAQS